MMQDILVSESRASLPLCTSSYNLWVRLGSYLRYKAQENIKNHIEEKIPMQFAECETGLKLILRKAHEIMNKSTRVQDQINAMGLAADIYSKLMDLSTNGTIIEKTTKWLAEKKQQLRASDEPDATEDQDITETKEDIPPEEEERNLREEQ
jgi:hypothetical protein